MSISNIKSIYFIRKLFSYVYEDRKLKLIVYNKHIQKIMDISITNYKFMSGKYVVYESNGLAKEYDSFDDKLLFKGEYLNRKRNGKGEEYNSHGEIKFSGEYLNGKRNGIGKEYYNNILLFEGEYLNGKKWNGKGYSKNGNIIYELKDGNGFVKEYDIKSEILFEGYYKNGERNGKGTEYDKEYQILTFDGEYYNGKEWNGKKYDINGIMMYELKNGKGLIKFYNKDNKLELEGGVLNGEYNGIIKDYDYNGNLLVEGEYLNGRKNGKIKEYYDSKLKFDGEYLYGHKIRGKQYTNEILEYEGEFLYDKKWSGKGYDKNGNIIYELINGNGKVKEYYYKDKLKFEGEYLNGKRNGKGKEYSLAGKLIYEGEYLNGNRYKGIFKKYAYLKNLRYEFEDKNNKIIKDKNFNTGILIKMDYTDGKWNEIGYDENGNIIYEIINGNGLRKIYNQYGELKFEGTYLNGELYGKAKEYNEYGELIFEGTYLNGKLNGKAKKFDKYNGEIIYESEYLNGEKNGKGKEYKKNGELIFEGEYLNGKRWNGKGKEYKSESEELIFEGEYLNGKRWNGKGKEIDWFDDIEFEGEYINGEKKPKKSE